MVISSPRISCPNAGFRSTFCFPDPGSSSNAPRGPLNNKFTFWHAIFTPSSAALRSQILEIVGLFLRSAQSVAIESDVNLGANPVELFLSGP